MNNGQSVAPKKTLTAVTAGYLPLLDAALLIAAKECGFAEAEGIDLQLVRESSWANIRDRMAVGHFQVAHMLAPLPIASKLGLTPMPLDVIVPMALGLGDGAEIRTPMALTVIFGLTTSALLTLIVIPTIYHLIERWKLRATNPGLASNEITPGEPILVK